jgi:hypothetical protein
MSPLGHGTNPLARECAAREAEQAARIANQMIDGEDGAGVPS